MDILPGVDYSMLLSIFFLSLHHMDSLQLSQPLIPSYAQQTDCEYGL